jgi:hypothetical protein
MNDCLHAWIILRRVTHAEIDEADAIAHTGITVVACRHCRVVELFPIENAALLTERYLTALRLDLAADNWNLPNFFFHKEPTE